MSDLIKTLLHIKIHCFNQIKNANKSSNVFVRVNDDYADGFVIYLYSWILRKGHTIVISKASLPHIRALSVSLIMFAMRTARRLKNTLVNTFPATKGSGLYMSFPYTHRSLS